MDFFAALVSGTVGDTCCDGIMGMCDHEACDWPDEHCDFDSGLCECSGSDCGDNGGGGGGGGQPPSQESGSWMSQK